MTKIGYYLMGKTFWNLKISCWSGKLNQEYNIEYVKDTCSKGSAKGMYLPKINNLFINPNIPGIENRRPSIK